MVPAHGWPMSSVPDANAKPTLLTPFPQPQRPIPFRYKTDQRTWVIECSHRRETRAALSRRVPVTVRSTTRSRRHDAAAQLARPRRCPAGRSPPADSRHSFADSGRAHRARSPETVAPRDLRCATRTEFRKPASVAPATSLPPPRQTAALMPRSRPPATASGSWAQVSAIRPGN
jgi:hypothetical protein